MSWIIGNSSTSIFTDLTSLYHNATTGELTQAQKDEIAKSSTQSYTPCADNPSSAECQSLYNQILNDVNIVAPSTDCKLRLSDNFCFQSWGGVATALVATIFALFVLHGIITAYASKRV